MSPSPEPAAAGTAICVKRADGGRRAERLRHEARVLHDLALPCMPRLIALRDDDARGEAGGVRLYTARIEGRTLTEARRHGRLPVPVDLVAGLARLLEDLAAEGIRHGDLSPDNVVLPAAGDRLIAVDWEGASVPRLDLLPPLPAPFTLGYAPPWEVFGDGVPGADRDAWAIAAILTWALGLASPGGGLPWSELDAAASDAPGLRAAFARAQARAAFWQAALVS